jgi:hypothetical protein
LFKFVLLLIILPTIVLSDAFDYIYVHGFGTVGMVYQGNEDIIYRNSYNTEKGSEADISFENDTKLGLQLDAKLNDQITFTLQGVASQNHGGGELIKVEWANLKYQPFDTLDIRAGIMQIPAFMYSDTLNISYAYNWVRLPNMYETIPFSSYKGAELNYLYDLDNFFMTLKLYYGSETESIKTICCSSKIEKTDLEIDNIYGAALVLGTDNFKFRVSYTTFEFSVYNKRMEENANSVQSYNIPIISQTYDHYKIKKTPSTYFAIGANYTFNNIYFVSEYINLDTESFKADLKSWYISSAYNYKQFTPYITYSRTISKSNYEDMPTENYTSADNAELYNLIENINYLFNDTATGTGLNQDDFTIGVRYDFIDNIAFKLQYDYLKEYKNKPSMPMHFNNEESTTLHIFSATVDFVF